MATAYIALGANLGDRIGTLREAVQRIKTLGRLIGVSSLYKTEPVGYLEQPSFLNSVVALDTALAPADLLHALLSIERELGRVRAFPNAPRTLDLDLLLVDDLILNTKELNLPHPRLHERAFVLIPMAEIGPGVKHPTLTQSVSELLLGLPRQSGVEVYASAGWEFAESG